MCWLQVGERQGAPGAGEAGSAGGDGQLPRADRGGGQDVSRTLLQLDYSFDRSICTLFVITWYLVLFDCTSADEGNSDNIIDAKAANAI